MKDGRYSHLDRPPVKKVRVNFDLPGRPIVHYFHLHWTGQLVVENSEGRRTALDPGDTFNVTIEPTMPSRKTGATRLDDEQREALWELIEKIAQDPPLNPREMDGAIDAIESIVTVKEQA